MDVAGLGAHAPGEGDAGVAAGVEMEKRWTGNKREVRPGGKEQLG